MKTPTTEESVQAALAAEAAAPFRAVGTPKDGPYGWRIVVTRVEDGETLLDLDYPEWSDWRASSAGHRLIEHGYMVSQPSHFHPERVAGWAVEPGGEMFTAAVYSRDHYVGPASEPEPKQEEEPEVQEELTATLWISGYSTSCGRCRKGTKMDATHHTVVLSLQDDENGRPGCGARFVEVGSHKLGMGPEFLQALRPDLPVKEQRLRTPGHTKD
ncbi:hypothetical protein ABT391_36795 [Streptomyces jumonjinensis]|uniref:hypothetical protein n=1 Tax=Streptomyces jumonjinensis TaxID=1945 RepID=UPI00331880E4